MAAVNFELRGYQREALRTLRTYLRRVVKFDGIAQNPAKAAFTDVAEASYWPAPLVNEQTPYVCIRIPTSHSTIGLSACRYSFAATPTACAATMVLPPPVGMRMQT